MKARQIAPLALILLGAVGCTGGGAGAVRTSAPESTVSVRNTALSSPAPSSTAAVTSSSPTPTIATTGPNVRPGEKPPTYPALSFTNTNAGALAFVNYWISALDWGYATTDSSLAKQNYLMSCLDCARFMKNFDDPKSSAEHFRGGRVRLIASNVVSNDNTYPGTTPVDITFGVAQLVTLNSAGKTVTTAPAIPTLTFRTWARWTGDRWKVAQEKQVERS